ncbi:MAG: 6-bladed beta-propeller [Candidatus Cloacimonas sp.]|nr:6-bladed beta-propeller [Candidatus Cloacimonas sp.]
MKKSLSMLAIIFIGWMSLWAIPQPLHKIYVSKDKKDSFAVDCFHLEGHIAYCVDNSKGIIKAWDIHQQSFLQPVFIKLPLKAKVDDLSGDETALYILDSKMSAIYVYDYFGTYVRTISTKGSADVQFIKAIRILVNYQGYIFVLDAGRNELLAFSNEGMFLGKIPILAPISMCLGQDQIIRILVNRDKTQAIIPIDQNLNVGNSVTITALDNKIDKISDIAMNQYNELYVIYSLSSKIGKVDASGKLINRSTWGSKDKSESMVSFQQPTIIKAIPNYDKVLIGILDNKIRTLKLYQDSEFSSTQALEVPQLTLRPKLSESTEPQAIDYFACKDRKYIIYNKTVQFNGANRATETISCIQNDTTIFNIYAVAEAKKGVQGYNALAIYNDKLFALDTKAAKVFVYNNLTGNYIESFAGKGSQDGHLDKPKSIAIDSDGMIYIADWGNSRIAIFDENTAHIHNIELKAKGLKPQLLRISGQNLYFLANDSSIYQMFLNDDSTLKMITTAEKISTFDILYEDRLGYIDGITQQLNVIYDNNYEHRYFSKNAKGIFPGFGNIYLIRYNPYNKTLYICDKMAKYTRLLTFYYSPKKPQTIYFTVNKAKQAELSWEAAEGISNWIVTEKKSAETKTYQVNEPYFIVYEPQREICTYIVQSVSADNKVGPPSEEIEDAYSYARYLSLNKHFAEAVQALQRAANTFSGVNFEDEMVQNFQQEARLYVSQNEFEKALNSIYSVEKIVGIRIDTAIQKAEIYKIMNDYKQGIAHLEKFRNIEDKGIIRELISLYYLDGNYSKVKELCNVYFSKFSRDTDILRYQIYADEKMKNYSAALNSMRELITQEDNLDNNIKMGGLLILNKDYEAALNSLQRTLNRFNNQGADVIQKLMGDCYFNAGNYAYAVDKYLDAIRLNSEVAEYYYCLGLAYTENRKAREATESFAKAYQSVPTEVKYGFAYAQALDKELRYPEALTVMDNIYQYVSSDSSSTAYHEFYHDLLIKEHRYDDAWREIQIALNYAPDNTTLQEKAVRTSDTRKYYNENRDEIEIKKYEFYKLFPALIEYYQTHPIGTVTLFNTRNISIERITVTVTIPQITDRPFQISIPTLMAGAELPIEITVPMNRNIFELCKNGVSTFNVNIQVDWIFDNKPKSVHKYAVIQFQSINSMDWNERKQYACFVNPADENLRNFVTTQIIQLFSTQPVGTINKNIQRAVQIWNFYSANGIKYISDISSANLTSSETDYVQFPFQTLHQKAGDCDDLLVLLASTLSVIGIRCGFLDIPGHVMLVIDTGMNSEDILSNGFELSQFIFRNGNYWLPVESTLLGKETFTTSWNEAVKHYNLLISKDIYPELMEFDIIHLLYPPAPYTEQISDYQFDKKEEVISSYRQDLERITLMGTLTKEEEFIATLKKYPTNLNVINQYALWCLENKNPEKANELWSQILLKDPHNLAALINLGNLQLSNDNFESARHNYLEALKQDKNTDPILRNLCILEYNSGNKLQAKEYFNRMSDKTLLKKANPIIYSELLNIGE